MEETSKKVRHTPGPWKLSDPNTTAHHGIGIHRPDDGNDYIICDVTNDGYDSETNNANAQLIAAAPSLLEALESVVSAFDISNEKYADWTGTHELYDAIIKVKEAIKLAKGNGES